MKILSNVLHQTGQAITVVAETKTRATSSDSAGKMREIKDPSPVRDETTSYGMGRHVNADDLKRELNAINEQLSSMNRSIQFSIDDQTEDIVVKIVDKSSGEVIAQIPSDNILKLRRRLEEMAGLVFEKTV